MLYWYTVQKIPQAYRNSEECKILRKKLFLESRQRTQTRTGIFKIHKIEKIKIKKLLKIFDFHKLQKQQQQQYQTTATQKQQK